MDADTALLIKTGTFWFELHQHYDFSEPQQIYNELIAAYSERQRAYLPSNIYMNA